MDLNGDGYADILSGTYSRKTGGVADMAGTFQVLWGKEGGFSVVETLNGSDGEPLIISTGKDQTKEELERSFTQRICTRPTAADLNGDGHLDLVVGNVGGTFYLFEGDGDGSFAPNSIQMTDGEAALKVPMHSDPFVVDWDADGDLDIVSGSAYGGVFLSVNKGSATEPEFAQFVKLIKPTDVARGKAQFEDELVGPRGDTRVWVDDLNGDGKLDLLVGDSVSVRYPVDGVSRDDVDEELAAWSQKQSELSNALNAASEALRELGRAQKSDDEETREKRKAATDRQKEASKKLTAWNKKRNDIVRDERTGFVWVYYQK